jgi:hypothetical protein
MHAYYQAEPKMLDCALSSLEIKYDDGFVIKRGLHGSCDNNTIPRGNANRALFTLQSAAAIQRHDGFDMHVLYIYMIIYPV